MRCGRLLLSPWSRLGILVALLTGGATSVAVWQPHHLLTRGLPLPLSGAALLVVFALAYGLCTAALVPRPLLNLASGTLLGTQAGLAGSVTGTVVGAGVAFGLGRMLGRDALRPLVKGRWLKAADHQLSGHAFRSVLILRVVPGMPFAGVNYCAAFSRMSCVPFLLATGLGCVPNTAAYVIAGSQVSDPLSPAFLGAVGFIVASVLGGWAFAWRRRGRARTVARGGAADPEDAPVTAGP